MSHDKALYRCADTYLLLYYCVVGETSVRYQRTTLEVTPGEPNWQLSAVKMLSRLPRVELFTNDCLVTRCSCFKHASSRNAPFFISPSIPSQPFAPTSRKFFCFSSHINSSFSVAGFATFSIPTYQAEVFWKQGAVRMSDTSIETVRLMLIFCTKFAFSTKKVAGTVRDGASALDTQ